MDKSKNAILGATIISIAAILWGFDGVVLTPQLYNLDLDFVVFTLHFIPFLLMNVLFYNRYGELKGLKRSELLSLLLVALFGGVIGTLSIVKALFLVNFQSLSIVVLLQKLQPIFAIFLAVIFLREKLRKRYIFWAIVALGAGYFLTFGDSAPNYNADDKNFLAAVYALLAAFSFGSATVFGKKVMNKLSFSSTTFFRYAFTSLIMFIVVLVNGSFMEFQKATFNNWIVIVFISLTTGSGSMMLYYYGLKKVKAIIATIAELFYPISAVFFDFWVNDNLLSSIQIIAAVLMIVAIINLNVDNARAIAKIKIKLKNRREKRAKSLRS